MTIDADDDLYPNRGALLRDQARNVLAPGAFEFFASGSGEHVTLAEQESAWRAVRLRPRILNDVTNVDTSVSLFGQSYASPVAVAPTALHRLAHPEGEMATARGARDGDHLFVLSMRSSARLDDVAPIAGPFWQQIYALRDRGVSDDVARRAADLGAAALVLTVDTPHVARKATGSDIDVPPTGIVAALDNRDLADIRYQQATDTSPEDIGRLHEISGLPVIAKGVLRGDDALRCVDAGAAGIVVSTHGGRQLDRVLSVPRALPEVVDAVADRADVFADGGICSGIDVLCALALGAKAVFVGRSVIWALATRGSDGVRDLLTTVDQEVREALALAGCRCATEVGRDLIAPIL